MIQTQNKFMLMKILIVVLSLFLITITSAYPADYTYLNCNNLDDESVTCELRKNEFYGVLNHLKIELNLQSIDISKTSVERCVYMDPTLKNSEGETFEQCYLRGGTITINTYEIYLLSENNSFLLVRMTNDAFIISQRETTKHVERIKQKITNLLNGTDKTTYEYENKHYSYGISFLTFFIAWIGFWYLQKKENEFQDYN